jgi:LysR family transcriptional regulator, transcriptional activator of nhaA
MPLDLNYHHLFYFWTTVRAGRVTAAARELHLSQSALSLQLMSLEKSLGRRLLERSRQGVELTSAGAEVYEHCERIFAAGAALSSALRGGTGGARSVLRLGVTSALGREVALAALRLASSRGDCVPSLVIEPRDDIRERLSRRRMDAALAGLDLSPQAGPGWRGRRLIALRMLFVAAPRLARSLGAFPRRGARVPMLMRTREHPMRERVEAYLHGRAVLPFVVAETEDSDLLRALAHDGRGVAALHETAVQGDLSSGRLVRVGPAHTGLAHEVWLTAPAHPPADEALAAALRRLGGEGALAKMLS